MPFFTVDDIRIVGIDLSRSASWAYISIAVPPVPMFANKLSEFQSLRLSDGRVSGSYPFKAIYLFSLLRRLLPAAGSSAAVVRIGA